MENQYVEYKVVISTPGYKIEGILVISAGVRLSDYLNNRERPFIPVIKTKMYDWKGEFLEESDFLSINKERIIWIKENTGKELF